MVSTSSTAPRTASLAPTRLVTRPRVTVIGAGPAGLTLGCLLQAAGIDCTILERHTRTEIEKRPRAGLWEHRTTEMLAKHGLAGAIRRKGVRHDACEFRIGGLSHVVKFGPLVNAAQWVLPQQDLVADLLREFLDRGGAVQFGVTDVAMQLSSTRAEVAFRDGAGHAHRLDSDFVAAADGAQGRTRSVIPPGVLTVETHEQPFNWLAVLAPVPPSWPHIVYAISEEGRFAGQMLRSPYVEPGAGPGAGQTAGDPQVTRFYLGCDRNDTAESWSGARIWEELERRLAPSPGTPFALRRVPIAREDITIVQMRSMVTTPMQYERLFLVGDAAHVITPVGAKGANLALHDAQVLGAALEAWARTGDEARLRAYSTTCLTRVWQCQVLSASLTQLLHGPDPRDPAATFKRSLHRADLEDLLTSPERLAAFARAYVGV